MSDIFYVDFARRVVRRAGDPGTPENPIRFKRLEDLPPGSKITSITLPPREPPARPAPPEPGSTFDCGPRISTSRGRRHRRLTDESDDWRW